MVLLLLRNGYKENIFFSLSSVWLHVIESTQLSILPMLPYAEKNKIKSRKAQKKKNYSDSVWIYNSWHEGWWS